jgi:hypothetical protein
MPLASLSCTAVSAEEVVPEGEDGGYDSAGTAVTTKRCGTTAAGASSAVTTLASRPDRWKKRGRTSAAFSAVSTFESSTTVV